MIKQQKVMIISGIIAIILLLGIAVIAQSIEPVGSKAWYTDTGIFWKDANNHTRGIIRYDLITGQDRMKDLTTLKATITDQNKKPIPTKNNTIVVTPFTKIQEDTILK